MVEKYNYNIIIIIIQMHNIHIHIYKYIFHIQQLHAHIRIYIKKIHIHKKIHRHIRLCYYQDKHCVNQVYQSNKFVFKKQNVNKIDKVISCIGEVDISTFHER